MNLYSIYDKKSTAFDQPIAEISGIEFQRRMMQFLSKNRDNKLVVFAHDYAVYLVGRFEEVTGTLISAPTPQFVEEMYNLIPKELRNEQA